MADRPHPDMDTDFDPDSANGPTDEESGSTGHELAEAAGGEEGLGFEVGPKAGTVALIGRPNAGKSTLMNRWLGEKISIVSDKPQTTRHRVVGILTEERGQIVFHDTPGVHRPLHRLNRQMVRFATDALSASDLVALIVDVSGSFGKGDAFLLDMVRKVKGKKVVFLNKIDRVSKPKLLPEIQRYADTGAFEAIVPISALSGDGADAALEVLFQHLPDAEPLYDPELLTIHPERFLVAERIREKVLAETRDELPFTTGVLLDGWEEEDDHGMVKIYATLVTESDGQRGILIGKGGQRIKSIGTAARHDLEEFLGRKVYLDLRVRHEPDWRENRRVLRAMEIDEDP